MAEEQLQQQKSKAKKGVKKTFFEVRTPLTATKIQLYGTSAEELEGKVVKLDLTRSLKGKNFELSLKVVKNEGVLEAEPIGIELLGSYIRRMMRVGIDYVEDSFVAECRDGKARVKPFMITRNKVSRAVRRELRNTARKFVEGHMKTRDTREIFTDIITNKMQKELFIRLKKIYPLALCEIRIFELVQDKK
jgi:ribosomal protein S3AE